MVESMGASTSPEPLVRTRGLCMEKPSGVFFSVSDYVVASFNFYSPCTFPNTFVSTTCNLKCLYEIGNMGIFSG